MELAPLAKATREAEGEGKSKKKKKKTKKENKKQVELLQTEIGLKTKATNAAKKRLDESKKKLKDVEKDSQELPKTLVEKKAELERVQNTDKPQMAAQIQALTVKEEEVSKQLQGDVKMKIEGTF